jgi:ABC-type multidrug transport system ATPase subunit
MNCIYIGSVIHHNSEGDTLPCTCACSPAGHAWGRTVVATLHQPSSQIFATFDDLLVLAEGATVYAGPASGLVTYFGKLGYVCPTYTNPADFLFMDVLHSSSKGKAAGGDVEAGQGGAGEDSMLVLAAGGKSSAQLADAAAQRAVSKRA